MNYSDYFEIKHASDEVSMDECISEAMRTDITFDDDKETLKYLKESKTILTDEVLTCYQFLKEQEILETYHKYRDGE